MRRAVVVVLDGLRRDLIGEETTPALSRFGSRAQGFAAHRSMFPSATRVVSASFATGCHPARHELQGNTLALMEGGRLVYHDAGHPEFLQHKRRVTGRSLAVPTLAERLAPHGGMILFSNVSPGAAYAHDPDGHGYVYHRAGSFAPGRRRLEGAQALDIAQDAAGERAMTERFIDEVLIERKPPLAILWMGEPDATQHVKPLGSPEHLAVLRQADANAGRVIEALDRLRDAGDEALLIVCSDHGHQTVSRIIDVEAELVAAGLKASAQVRRCRDADERHLHPRLRPSRSCSQGRGHRRIPDGARLGRQGGAGGGALERRPGAAPWPGVRRLAQVGGRAQPLRRAGPELRVRSPSPARRRTSTAASTAASPSTSRCRS